MPAGAEVIHFSAAEPAGDLVLSLNQRGFSARKITVYESRAATSKSMSAALAAMPWMDGVLVHSAKAARIAADLIADCGEQWQGVIYCISEAVADPFRSQEGSRLLIAKKPNERAMLDLIAHA